MRKPVRILLLEDNASDFELVREFLGAEGLNCRITHATNRGDFEKSFASQSFDLVLADYAVPGYSGVAALQVVRATDTVVPFILLSGTLSEEEAVESLRAGATDYIIKNRLHRLVPAIDRALNEAEIRREHLSAAEALRASEERFKLAARATNDVIWEWDLASDEIWCSETFDDQFGYHHGSRTFSAQEKVSRIRESDQPRVAGRMQEKLRSRDTSWVEEYDFQRRDGAYAHVLDRALIIRGEDGRPTRLIGAMTDMTHRREAEAQIREQAALLDKARDAIVLVGMDQRVLYWNKSAERIFGWTVADAIGRDINEFLLRRDVASNNAFIARLMQESEWRGELDGRAKNGKRIIVESRWSLMRDDDEEPKGILLINTDITDKKEIEAQFFRAQRIQTIGELSGGIAHDLNNALSPIVMASELLGEEVTSESGKRMLELMRASGRRCADMVKQILSFSRGKGQAMELLDPCDIVEELAALTRETFPRLITIETNCEPRVNHFQGNLTQMHQVMMNLLVNARDAITRDGTIRISAKNVLLHAYPSKMLDKPADGPFVSIAISDTGSGIPPTILDKIFEPFFTTKDVGKGTGLGLSTVFAIVKSHGGFLELTTDVGKGTTFELFFPAHVREPRDPAKDATAALPAARGEQLLIVDDEVGLLAMVKTTLETLGYRVLTASDGLEAVKLLENSRADIDLVLTDWNMPVMSGAELIRKIHGAYPDLKLVVVTGGGGDGEANIAGLPVEGVLQKPYTTEAMLKVIREVLGKTQSGRG
ncbi:MAG TPA: response regulator [Verrucomicrobiae bacterium]|nr:response regulator [Verrucomicrobiae bacterium]